MTEGYKVLIRQMVLECSVGGTFSELFLATQDPLVQYGRTSRVRIGILQCSYRLKIKMLVIGKNFFNSMNTSCKMRA